MILKAYTVHKKKIYALAMSVEPLSLFIFNLTKYLLIFFFLDYGQIKNSYLLNARRPHIKAENFAEKGKLHQAAHK